MDIVVTGRHCTVSPDLKDLVTERIATVERLRDRVIRVEVEFSAESIKDPSGAMAVQITMRSRGPVIRAEARAGDKNSAFDQAFDRLKAQLRKAADRRKTHQGLRLASALDTTALSTPTPDDSNTNDDTYEMAGIVVDGDGPLVVREKEFDTSPLSLAQALDEMELVGHDFFLYQDVQTGRPSVVYRRKAYNYGVIHLNVS